MPVLTNSRAIQIIIAAAFALAFAPQPARAITGTVERIAIQHATDDELYEAPLARGHIVQSDANPQVVMIGDGYTPGGKPIIDPTALHDTPHNFTNATTYNANHLKLNAQYSINAEGGRLTLWDGTNAAFQIVATAPEASKAILGWHSNPDATVTLLVASPSTNIGVYYTTNLVEGLWTAVNDVQIEQVSAYRYNCTFTPPDSNAVFRVSIEATSPAGITTPLPITAPAIKVGTLALGTNQPVSDWPQPKKLLDGTNVFELVGSVATLNGKPLATEPEVIYLSIGEQTYEYDTGVFAWKWDWTTNLYAPKRTIVFDDDVGDLPYVVFPPPYTPAVAQEIIARCGGNGMAVGFPDGVWAHGEGGAWFAYTYVPTENKWVLSSCRIDIAPPSVVPND